MSGRAVRSVSARQHDSNVLEAYNTLSPPFSASIMVMAVILLHMQSYSQIRLSIWRALELQAILKKELITSIHP